MSERNNRAETEAQLQVGHSGASGAVAFHAPQVDLYVTGTVNQVQKRSLVYQLLTGIVMLGGT
jgi:hypothetical protein